MEALQLIALIFLCVVFRFSSLALILWFEAYYPEAATRIHETYNERGRRCVFLGLFNLSAWTFVALLLIGTKVLSLFGLALLMCLGAASIIGFAPAYRELGQRFEGSENRPVFRSLIYGFVCLEAAFLVPFIGQALAFGVLVRGLGAVISTMLAMRRSDSPTDPDPVDIAPSSEADATT